MEIASIPGIPEAMRDVMMTLAEQFSPATSSPPLLNGSSSNNTPNSVAEEPHLKADTPPVFRIYPTLMQTMRLSLARRGQWKHWLVAVAKLCAMGNGVTNCMTNACLALMNLNVSKTNEHKVFKTDGVTDALMKAIVETLSSPGDDGRVGTIYRRKDYNPCLALSNLAPLVMRINTTVFVS